MTTQDLIKILPLGQPYRDELLNKFDTLNPDQKSALADILWRTYREFRQMRIDQNLQLAFKKAANNEEKLDQGFYKRVVEQTEKELDEETTKTVTTFDLSETRQELQGILDNKTGKNSPKS